MNQNQAPAAQGRKSPVILILVLILAILIVVVFAFYFLLYRSNKVATVASSSPSVSASPLATSSVSPGGSVKASHCLKTPTKSDQITVSTPTDYSEVSAGSLLVEGTANAFESSFNYRVKDCNDAILATGYIQAVGEMGQNPPYTKTLTFQKKSTSDIVVELYEQSAADGSEIHLTQVPLRLK